MTIAVIDARERQFVVMAQGTELIAPLLAGAAAAAARAEQAADIAEGIAGSITPQGTATTTTNTGTETVYAVTLPAGYDPAPNGSTFSFIVPATSASSTIRLNVAGVLRDVFMQIGQPLRMGWIATFRSNTGGGKWDLVSQVPNGLAMLEVERSAWAALRTGRLAAGTDTILQPINGNPDDLYIDIPRGNNDDFFWGYVLAANVTDGPIITTSDGYRYAVTECPPGTLRPGDRVRIVYSGGIANFIYRERQTLPTLTSLAPLVDSGTDLIAKFVRDFHAAQWATGGAQPVPFAITTAGSSVTTEISSGRAGATDYAPSHRLVDLLNGYTGSPSGIPTGARVPGTKVIDDNWSHGGHSISQFASQIYESPYWQAGTTRALMLNPGPNDFRVGGYNSGQTLPGAATVLESLIGLAIERGIPVFMTTPFDPDVSQENYASFFTDNPGIAQSYPYPVTAPTDPETEQYPPASQSSGMADMTGHGVAIPFDRRFEHGTMIVRALAAKYPKVVVLIDSRKAYHRAVEALQPNAYEKRILYGTGDSIHPLRYAHDRGFGIPLLELAQDVLAARPLKPVYEGRDGANYGQ